MRLLGCCMLTSPSSSQMAHQYAACNSLVRFSIGCGRREPENKSKSWNSNAMRAVVERLAWGYETSQCSASFTNSGEESMESCSTACERPPKQAARADTVRSSGGFMTHIVDSRQREQLSAADPLVEEVYGHQLHENLVHETLVRLPSRRVTWLPNSRWHLADELARKETQFSFASQRDSFVHRLF